MSKETWKDYYYKNFKRGIHDVGRNAVKETFEYQQEKIDMIEKQANDLLQKNEELRLENSHYKFTVEKLLEAVAWHKLYVSPGSKPYMLEKAEKCFLAANIKEN